jgi:hypothetical protein
MRYPVLKKFRDKHTRVKYVQGDVYETESYERVAELKGYVGRRVSEPKPVEPDEAV